jgi:hypothetical protein
MSFTQNEEVLSFIADADLTSAQYRIVDLTSTKLNVDCAAASGGIGVLKNKPQDTEHASVVVRGVTKVQAGASVSLGNFVKSAASGYAVPVGSGTTTQRVIGRALEAISSGMVGSILLTGVFQIGSGDLL